MKQFGVMGFVGRWFAAFTLLVASFNPTGYSFYHWAVTQWPITEQEMLPLKVLAALILLIGYIIFFRATFRSIGVLGVVLVSGILATLVWLFMDLQWLKFESKAIIAWVTILGVTTILAIGLSWSHVRRRLTGQLDTDDVDE